MYLLFKLLWNAWFGNAFYILFDGWFFFCVSCWLFWETCVCVYVYILCTLLGSRSWYLGLMSVRVMHVTIRKLKLWQLQKVDLKSPIHHFRYSTAILTIPRFQVPKPQTSSSLRLQYHCNFMMNIIKERSEITKIENYVIMVTLILFSLLLLREFVQIQCLFPISNDWFVVLTRRCFSCSCTSFHELVHSYRRNNLLNIPLNLTEIRRNATSFRNEQWLIHSPKTRRCFSRWWIYLLIFTLNIFQPFKRIGSNENCLFRDIRFLFAWHVQLRQNSDYHTYFMAHSIFIH